MSCLNPTINSESITFDMVECIEEGKKSKTEYVSAAPFPHIVKDDFLPTAMLKRVLDEFPQRETGQFADAHSRKKTGYQLEKIRSTYITNLMFAFNSAAFVRFLE